MTKLSALASAGALLLAGLTSATDALYTPIHEAGRCAIRDHCGAKSFFGKQLPCVDNGKAREPDADLRSQLVELCGPKWKDGPVCCTNDQVGVLRFHRAVSNIVADEHPHYRSHPSKTSYQPRTPSYHRALHARTTSTTSSAPSRAPPTSLSS